MLYKVTMIFLLVLFIFPSTQGCSRNATSLIPPPGDSTAQEWYCGDGREVLGRYTLIIDPLTESAEIIPWKNASVDKGFLSWDYFTVETKYVSLLRNPLCCEDWLAGDITFKAVVTNLSGTDYYDVWLAILNGHGGELANPSSWGSSSEFAAKSPYIAFCTDKPQRILPAGGSDTRTHIWRNPCGNNPINVDLALVGKPGSVSKTPGDVTPDPRTISIPLWSPPEYANLRVRVSDHQGDAIVAVDSNNVGIPFNYPLYDDGAHGDGGPNDGLYATGNLPVGSPPIGIYEAWIRAVSPGDIIKVYNKIDVRVGYINATWDNALSLRKTDYLNQIGYCDLAMDSTGRIHFAWAERYDWGGVYVVMCYYRNYKDGVLSDTVHINQDILMYGGSLPYLSNPQLVVGPNDEVYVFWHQWSHLNDGKVAMYTRMRKDGVWRTPKRIDGDSPNPICSPQAVCTTSGRIFLAAKNYKNGTYGICATSVQAGSDEWPATTRLFNSGGSDIFNLEGIESMKAASDGFVYLAFTKRDGGSDYNIYILKINPGSMEAFAPVRVSDPDGAANKELRPCVWTDPSGIIGVVWDGIKEAGSSRSLIYYDISNDAGQTWGTDRLAFSEGDYDALAPVMKAYGPGLWGLAFSYYHRNLYTVTFNAGKSFSPIESMQDFASTNLPNFITGPAYESWHVWRSNLADTEYNIYLKRRHY